MEEEAEKLKEIQGEVEKQMMSTAKSRECFYTRALKRLPSNLNMLLTLLPQLRASPQSRRRQRQMVALCTLEM